MPGGGHLLGLLGRARLGDRARNPHRAGRTVAIHRSRAQSKAADIKGLSRRQSGTGVSQIYRTYPSCHDIWISSTLDTRKMHSSSKVKESPQYGAISKYLAGEESLDSALDTFCAGVEAKFKDTQNAEDVEEMLWQAWRATVTMAASIPHASDSRQKLVDFVLELQKRPTLSKDDQACIVQDGTVWKDLPAFGMEMREAWNLVATNESSAEQQDKWINLNAWTATLVATVHARDLTSPDFSLYCIWVVRVALEEEGPANVSMEAAGMWFLYASPTIYQLCLADETFDGKIAKPGSLFKDREWRGFSQSRWATWLQQMEKAGQASSEDKIAKVAADAVAAMKAAER